MWSVYPVVNNIEAASPIALPKDSKTAVTTLGITCLRNTLNAVSDFVEPKENDASISPSGTVLNTSSIARIIIGIINRVTVIIPAKSDVLIPK